MDTGDFYDLACFNPFHHFDRLGSISGSTDTKDTKPRWT